MSKKILIVDDDRDLVQGLTVRLQHEGFHVVSAGDCYGALSMAQREKPDLMILDLGLPGGDGFTAMTRMNVNTNLWGIPVIVLSARDPQGNRKRSKELGARAYFQKPADNIQLLATIGRILGEETVLV